MLIVPIEFPLLVLPLVAFAIKVRIRCVRIRSTVVIRSDTFALIRVLSVIRRSTHSIFLRKLPLAILAPSLRPFLLRSSTLIRKHFALSRWIVAHWR